MAPKELNPVAQGSGNLLFTSTPVDRARGARATYCSGALFHSIHTFSALCSFPLGALIWKVRGGTLSPGDQGGRGQGQWSVPWLTIV